MANDGGMALASGVNRAPIHVDIPGNLHHKELISCQVACPVHTDARGYVRAIADGDFERAYLIARGPNPFASICGRICGAPCELSCRRGKIPRTDDDGFFVATDRPIAIRALKRFVCESHGAEARPAAAILEALQGHLSAVAGDAEEMASYFAQPFRDLSFGRKASGSRSSARVQRGSARRTILRFSASNRWSSSWSRWRRECSPSASRSIGCRAS
jgi:hypothetical protein